MKKSFLLRFGGALITSALFLACPLLAAEAAASSAMDAGNKMCPVSGDKISGKDFVEYQGKKYALCCPLCAKDFKKDPQKYIARLNSKNEASAPEGSQATETKVIQVTGSASEDEEAISKMVLPPLPGEAMVQPVTDQKPISQGPVAMPPVSDQKTASAGGTSEGAAAKAGTESKRAEPKKEEKRVPQMYYN